MALFTIRLFLSVWAACSAEHMRREDIIGTLFSESLVLSWDGGVGAIQCLKSTTLSCSNDWSFIHVALCSLPRSGRSTIDLMDASTMWAHILVDRSRPWCLSGNYDRQLLLILIWFQRVPSPWYGFVVYCFPLILAAMLWHTSHSIWRYTGTVYLRVGCYLKFRRTNYIIRYIWCCYHYVSRSKKLLCTQRDMITAPLSLSHSRQIACPLATR